MSFTIAALADHLGKPATDLLAQEPFKNWIVQRSCETDLQEPRVYYEFEENGMEFICDCEDKVNTIFLYANQSRCFEDGVDDLPFASTRREVIARLGPPSKSGGPRIHPILGESGIWDRFTRPGYAVRVQFRLQEDAIEELTVMRADVVP